MPTEEQMTVNERRKYLKLMKPLYQQAKRGERSRLLSEMQEVTGLHRKSLLRLLHASSLARKQRTTPRKRTYGLAVEQVDNGGESSSGENAHTIQLIDVATGWSERVAVLGRGQTAMEGGFRRILSRIPFAIVELHPDNGSEFFNQHLVRFWKDKVK